MAIEQWDGETFRSRVLQRRETALVDFWAEWCGSCRRLEPALGLAAQKHPELTTAKVSIDQAPQLARDWGVEVIPTLLAFRDGEEAGRLTAPESRQQIEAFIQTALS